MSAAVFLVLIGATVAAAAVAPMLVVRAIPGTPVMAPRPPVKPGEDELLDPVPTLPTDRWRIDATQLSFGADDDPHYLIVTAVTRDLIIVRSLPAEQHGAGKIAAVNAHDGRPMWDGPSDFIADSCTFSRDERLACVHSKTQMVGFIDPQSGRVLGTQPIGLVGSAGIRRAGDGFLVVVKQYLDDVGNQAELTWFSSDGSRSWSHKPPVKLDWVALSEAGNVVTVDELQTGAQALELDTGRLLYDATADLARAGESAHVMMAPSAGGFAVGIRVYGDDQKTRVILYDADGATRREMPGWSLGILPGGTETDRIVGMHGSNVGVIETSTNRVVWEHDGGSSYDDPERVAGAYVLVEKSVGYGRSKRTIYDMSTGTETGTITSIPMLTLVGFDGQRMVFDVLDDKNDYRPTLVAFDITGGNTVWRIEVNASADDVNLQAFEPFLFRYDGKIGDSVAAVTLLASS